MSISTPMNSLGRSWSIRCLRLKSIPLWGVKVTIPSPGIFPWRLSKRPSWESSRLLLSSSQSKSSCSFSQSKVDQSSWLSNNSKTRLKVPISQQKSPQSRTKFSEIYTRLMDTTPTLNFTTTRNWWTKKSSERLLWTVRRAICMVMNTIATLTRTILRWMQISKSQYPSHLSLKKERSRERRREIRVGWIGRLLLGSIRYRSSSSEQSRFQTRSNKKDSISRCSKRIGRK